MYPSRSILRQGQDWSHNQEIHPDPRYIADQTWYWVRWISAEGRPVQEEWLTPGSVVRTTYSGWGEVNTIPSAPIQGTDETTTEDPIIEGTATPTPENTPTATPEDTPTPCPANTPTPVPTSTSVPSTADAWLEPDTETITFDGQWRRFTIRGTGLRDIYLAINVINYPDGPSSTGAVELDSHSSLPSATDACRTTYYSGYSVSVGYTFSLVGCRAGTVIIRLEDPANDRALIREYTVTVSGGP